jgi:hypothetical protein
MKKYKLWRIVALIFVSFLAIGFVFPPIMSGMAAFANLATNEPWQVLGLILFFWPILAAFPLHYYLNVRKTNEAGVIEVAGFTGYMTHLALNLIARIGLPASMILGIYVFFAFR